VSKQVSKRGGKYNNHKALDENKGTRTVSRRVGVRILLLLCPAVRVSARTIAASAARMSVKFDIAQLYDNLSNKCKSG